MSSGCGEQHPKAPLGSYPEASKGTPSLGKKTTGSGSNTSSDTRVERYSILNLALMQIEDLAVAQWVKASTGGTLYLGEFKFYIPPGSLAKDTMISIAMTSDKYIQMDFGPDGTQFNPPATMTVTYATANLKNLKPSNLSISWFDTTKNQWINLGGSVNQSTMTVSVPVTHFTEYTLSTR
jgi:hypothetical protein